jgi:hypothetical protein
MNRIIVLIVFFLFPPLMQAATIENDFILVYVDEETGRMFLSTVAGKADIQGDEKVDLLFFDNPPSSYTVIYVNDDAYIFGGQRGTFVKRPLTLGKSISTIWENEIVNVELTIRFIGRKDSGVEDGMLISYRVENKTEHSISVGLRILLDTYLGEKGRCHFTAPDVGEICNESEFQKSEIPLTWMSVGLPGDCASCLRGVLKEGSMIAPDKIVFANYRALRENLGYYRIRKKRTFDYPPYSMNDSAVTLYYNPASLQAGQWRAYSTILGLCDEGEYAEETVEIGKQEEIVQQPSEQETSLPLKEERIETLDKINLNRIKKELKDIKLLMSSRQKINEIIEGLNQILETDDKWLDEEEAIRMKNTLKELEEMPRSLD